MLTTELDKRRGQRPIDICTYETYNPSLSYRSVIQDDRPDLVI